MTDERAQPSLLVTVGLFALAFLVPAWPWLSGAVTVPYDAKSTFYPPVAFLARAFAAGEWPFWTPNVFAGWPNIADPQSMLASPLHVLLAWISSAPSFRAVDAVTFAYLFAGGLGIILYFRDRGWHAAGALVAALAFAFGGAASARLQHTGQVVSLAYLPIALWLLARALDRASWRYGALAGVAAALIVLGRDQVALLEVYVLIGFVAAHWRPRMGVAPLIAGALAGAAIIAVPVIMTELLALDSNRPEFGFIDAGRGSLHPAHLLSLVFPDLFGAMDPAVDFWGPGGYAWNERFGMADLFLAQNMGLLYAGALVPVALIVGVTRGVLWSREIRFFAIAAVLIALYAVGRYTPAFWAMYELLPGVKLFRRPADATFLLGALFAILAGYVVHLFIAGLPPANRIQTWIERALGTLILAITFWLIATIDASPAVFPLFAGLVFVALAILMLRIARRLDAIAPLSAMLLLMAFTAADLAFNNAPHESTGLPLSVYDALRPDTRNETVALIRQRLAAQAPNHRDRVELIGVGYHWPNICLIHGCEHVFGHNPLRLKWFYDATRVGDTVAAVDQRPFSPLYPSYRSTFADLLGLRVIAMGVPIEQIDKAIKSGDLILVARTGDAYVYENPRAMPRVMMVGDWRVADFAKLVVSGWPTDVDAAKTVLLEQAPRAAPLTIETAGTARLVRYANTEVVIEVDSPSGGMVVLNDVWHPWWRATIDGIETEIFRANAIFRAVQVPPGKFTVRFTFAPLRGAWQELRDKIRRP
jgi:Dolichyl-phosphate-mannose-protein mannosyltransferase